ncbi:hypothetical protein E4U17_001651 [Claviceps sp. LM77 group G4]|nr:hypothetical protein E4U17_001651 [Claviceps sp. LM77 group G4]KAG6044046.1 hypothetical protein E4U33_001585 [Claviceps sp. LM78 group G4]KAG6069923.1 hypothetical protein E4U16_007275 [Claviceps sp. LM84 group G4]
MPSINLSDASLLLLPPPPEPPTTETIWLAYHKPLDATISRLSNEHKINTSGGTGPTLIVAVVCSILTSDQGDRRLIYWHRLQALLAQVYSLLAAICENRSIATDIGADDPGAVDSRVVLVNHNRATERLHRLNHRGVCGPNNTAVLDLAAFASINYPWNSVLHTGCEQGYELLTYFLEYHESRRKLQHRQLVAVEGGLGFSKPASATVTDQNSGNSDFESLGGYSKVCLGGTFDHLHLGHKLFLHAAVLLLNIRGTGGKSGHQCELVVGISSDELLATKQYAEELQSWDVRARSVLQFLSTLLSTSPAAPVQFEVVIAETKELHAPYRNGSILVRCVDFHDVYGPTVKEEAIEALVVSAETRSGGDLVNKKRHSQGWSMLNVYEIDVLDTVFDTEPGKQKQGAVGHFGSKISSTYIRRQKAEGRGAPP